MNIKKDQQLQAYNTFGIKASTKGLIRIYTVNDVYETLVEELSPIRILGGGSNILMTGDFDGYILKNEIKGIDILDEDDDQVLVNVGAGEQWHNFVMWSIGHNLAGIENLALIPGSVGAAPMQNIGAYGVEQEACFHSLLAIDMATGVKTTFFKKQCKFGYRESIFKHEFKDRYFIIQVRYLLRKTNHVLHLDYGAIRDQLALSRIDTPTIRDVAEAVIAIRQSKLPDPRVIGNAGSFFKNPVISMEVFHKIKAQFPEVPSYPVDNESIKVPAGWLIEKLGFKGYKNNDIGVHANQALVLVNYGNGAGADILALAKEIQQKVKESFDVDITPEVNIW